jgi:hypothetical protein
MIPSISPLKSKIPHLFIGLASPQRFLVATINEAELNDSWGTDRLICHEATCRHAMTPSQRYKCNLLPAPFTTDSDSTLQPWIPVTVATHRTSVPSSHRTSSAQYPNPPTTRDAALRALQRTTLVQEIRANVVAPPPNNVGSAFVPPYVLSRVAVSEEVARGTREAAERSLGHSERVRLQREERVQEVVDEGGRV